MKNSIKIASLTFVFSMLSLFNQSLQAFLFSQDTATPALMQAIKNDDLEGVKTAIANKANVNNEVWSPAEFPVRSASLVTTALKDAVDKGNSAIVDTLLKAGANPKVVPFWAGSLLHLAPNSAVAKLLIKAGLDINFNNRWDRIDTPLHEALKNHRDDVAELLIDSGAKISIPGTMYKAVNNGASVNIIKKLLELSKDYREKNGDSFIHGYAQKGGASQVKDLIDAGANVNVLNNNKETPLHLARTADIADVLLKAGISIEAEDNNKKTPLHSAVFNDKIDVAKKLLQEKANIDARDKYGYTPLHYAKSGAMVKVLMDAGANIHATGKNGNTPLHSAQTTETAQALINHGANLNKGNNTGLKPYDTASLGNKSHIAQVIFDALKNKRLVPKLFQPVKNNNLAAVRKIIAQKPNVNIPDAEGNTLLHYAQSPEMVNMLIAAGADVHAKNKEGQTALEIAQNPQVIRALIKAGGQYGE
jgi:ankyrin repeat protein